MELKYHRECKYILKMRVWYNRKIILSCSTKRLKRHLYKMNCFANDIYFILKIKPETFVFRHFCKWKTTEVPIWQLPNWCSNMDLFTFNRMQKCIIFTYTTSIFVSGPSVSKGQPTITFISSCGKFTLLTLNKNSLCVLRTLQSSILLLCWWFPLISLLVGQKKGLWFINFKWRQKTND